MVNSLKGKRDMQEQKTTLQIMREKHKAQQEEQKAQHEREKAKQKMLGAYRKVITDSFISVFDRKYGDEVNYESIVNSLSFDIKEKGGKESFDFRCNESDVEFVSDVHRRNGIISENQREEFISSNDMVKGIRIEDGRFSSFYEREGYKEASDIDRQGTSPSDDDNRRTTPNDGRLFIPVSAESRYGEFHKMQHTGVYTPVSKTVEEAVANGEDAWKQQMNLILNKGRLTDG